MVEGALQGNKCRVFITKELSKLKQVHMDITEKKKMLLYFLIFKAYIIILTSSRLYS